MIIYCNGIYIPHDEAQLSPFDRGLLYGAGAFETIRSYSGFLFMLDEHVERLRKALLSLNISPPRALEGMSRILGRLLKLNALSDARLRITVTAGSGSPTLICTAGKLSRYGEDLYEKGASAILMRDPRRFHHRFSSVKSTSYVGNYLIRAEASRRGAIEAILCDGVYGPIECSMSNLFIVEGGMVVTPPLSCTILPGITRRVVLELARGLELPVREETFTEGRLMESDEVFITNTLMEVMPVTELDRKAVGDGKPGEVSSRLLSLYRRRVSEEAGRTAG